MSEDARPFPRKWRVGPHDFVGDHLEPGHKLLQGKLTRAIMHPEAPERGIYISSDADLREQLELLCHEVKHAMCYAYDFKLSGKAEERLALFSGRAWSSFFIDNPQGLRWINWAARELRRTQKRA